jgi:hypothetical protein
VADLPAPILPRAALERVLLRAAELHSASGEVPEAMSEADLLALAKEVGISPLAVKQALAEERMRVTLPEEKGFAASLVGPAFFSALRVVPGNAREVLDRIDRAFRGDESLAERRRFPDRIVYGPLGGLAGAAHGVAAGFSGRSLALAKTNEVSVSVVQVEPGKAHVRIEATLAPRRIAALRIGAGGLVGGSIVGAVLLALNVWPVVAVGVAGLLGILPWIIARSMYRGAAHGAQLALEQTLDRLEFGEPRKRGLLDQLLSADRK